MITYYFENETEHRFTYPEIMDLAILYLKLYYKLSGDLKDFISEFDLDEMLAKKMIEDEPEEVEKYLRENADEL